MARPSRRIDSEWIKEYKFHELFTDKQFVKKILAYQTKDALRPGKIDRNKIDNSYVGQLYRYALLSVDGEWSLFMKMNCAKHLFNSLTAELETDPGAAHLLRKKISEYQRIARETRSDIASHNLRLVIKLAQKQAQYDRDFDECIQLGNLALVRAIDKFDPNRLSEYKLGTPNQSKPNRFSTYATWAIQNAMWDTRGLSKELLMSDFTDDELPIVDPRSLDNQFRCEEAEINSRVLLALAELPERQRQVIERRHASRPETLEIIGRSYNITKERVRQIYDKGIIKVKGSLGVELTAEEREVYCRMVKHEHR